MLTSCWAASRAPGGSTFAGTDNGAISNMPVGLFDFGTWPTGFDPITSSSVCPFWW